MVQQTEFRAWMAAARIIRVYDAGERLGIGDRTTDSLASGQRMLTTTERLAMAAVLAGLPPYRRGDEPAPARPQPPPEPSNPRSTRRVTPERPMRATAVLRRRRHLVTAEES